MINKYTILTCTYNRAHTLENLYKSILRLNYKDFTWLIIDDGSTDSTSDLIKKFNSDKKVHINYYYKKNGGKHTAINFAYKYIKTPFVIIIDSDDEILENAFVELDLLIEKISEDKFYAISARCIDSRTKEIVGKPFPNNINNLRGFRKKRQVIKSYGEKCTCYKTKILTKYIFPEYNDTKFVPESIVWRKIEKTYDEYYTNTPLRVYHQDQPDSLSKGYMHTNQKNRAYYYMSREYINNYSDIFWYNPKTIIFHFINISRTNFNSKHSVFSMLKDVKGFFKKSIVLFFMPFGYIMYLYKRNNKQ